MSAIILCRIFIFQFVTQKDMKIEIYRIIIVPAVLYGCET